MLLLLGHVTFVTDWFEYMYGSVDFVLHLLFWCDSDLELIWIYGFYSVLVKLMIIALAI
jgi:hypothetical protein